MRSPDPGPRRAGGPKGPRLPGRDDGSEEEGYAGVVDGVPELGIENDGRKRGGADRRRRHGGVKTADGLLNDMWRSAPVEHQGAKATETQARDGLVAERANEDQDGKAAFLTPA